MKKIVIALSLLMVGAKLSAQEATSVVISEVCGGGTNRRDFVELYNPTFADIDISGWMVKYKSATGSQASSATTITFLPGSIIKSRGYFLVGFIGTQAGFVADAENTAIDMSSSTTGGGHAALCRPGTTGPAMWNNQIVVDLVGWGTGNAPEGTAAPFHPSLGGSLERKASATSSNATMAVGGTDADKGNGYDTNNNSADFIQKTVSNPQNSSSTLELPDYLTQFSNTYPNVSSIAAHSFNLNVNVDRSGKVYYVVLSDGVMAPSAAQVKSGTDGNDTPVAFSGFINVGSSNTTYSTSVTGLTENTDYDIYLVAENYYERLQASATKVEASTIGVLPVEFLDFKASLLPNRVKLDWSTATENNNDYFLVERSLDGISYKLLSTVKGSALSKSKRSYTAYDEQPIHGNLYYRLKQFDLDGKEKELADVSVDFKFAKAEVAQIYPNPTQGEFYVYLAQYPDHDFVLEVRDLLGKLVYSEDVKKSTAEHSYLLKPSKKLVAGQYIVSIKGSKLIAPMKLIVK